MWFIELLVLKVFMNSFWWFSIWESFETRCKAKYPFLIIFKKPFWLFPILKAKGRVTMGSAAEVLVSSPFRRSLSRHFFCVFLSHRSFRFRCLSRAARLEIQGFSEKYYLTVWRFFRKPKAWLLFPKPAAIPLHLHDNGWCQKERPCEGKKIRAANENRHFTEVFGLHDYRKLFSEKWIQLLFSNVFRKMEIAYKNGKAFREISMKECIISWLSVLYTLNGRKVPIWILIRYEKVRI